MKNRTKKVLEILTLEKDYISVPSIAEKMKVSVRTIFRDIAEIEILLRHYGIHIESKRGVGVRLSGNLEKFKQRRSYKLSKIEWSTTYERQFLIFIFIGLNLRIIKISEIATLFYVSDSCISSDLQELDMFLKKQNLKIKIKRDKGVGVSIFGEEWVIRMALLTCILELLTLNDVSFLIQTKNISKFTSFFNFINTELCLEEILTNLKSAERRLATQFSWMDFILAFFYLIIALQRKNVKEKKQLLFSANEFNLTKSKIHTNATKKLWHSLTGKSDKVEINWLKILFLSFESNHNEPPMYSHKETSNIVKFLSSCLSESGFFVDVLDLHLAFQLKTTFSKILYEKKFFIPNRLHVIGKTTYSNGFNELFRIKIIPYMYERTGIVVDEIDLEPIKIILLTAINIFIECKPKIRIAIVCLEGLFLAQHISSIISLSFPDVIVVDILSRGTINEQWVVSQKLDLILTTFPTGIKSIREHIINLPIDEGLLKATLTKIFSTFSSLSQRKKIDANTAPFDTITTKSSKDFKQNLTVLDTIISILQSFELNILNKQLSEKDLINLISNSVGENKRDINKLKKDLLERESFGQVILENSGIRLFHCRSTAVKFPYAGVIRLEKTNTIFVYLIAPSPAKKEEIKVLSTISISLIENNSFCESLKIRDKETIRKELFSIFANTLL